MLSDAEIVEAIGRESEAFVAAVSAESLERAVPGCPEWNQWALVDHLGGVQRFWARVIHSGGEIPDDPPALDVRDAPGVQAWFRSCTGELLDAVQEVAWGTHAWTWWGEPATVGAIARHQSQEAAVHRWDAQSAIGAPLPLAVDLADDALHEFLDIFNRLDVAKDLPGAVALHVDETGSEPSVGSGAPQATISGGASDLLLYLYGRVPESAVRTDGDRAVLDAFLAKASTE